MSGAGPGESPRFAGRVAVVTGAGAGVGALYVAALARERAAVVAVDQDAARGRAGRPRRPGPLAANAGP
jgi:NAD(P)-dependent dehydrogenase (short-subunit alcohol dehydrogenase family)